MTLPTTHIKDRSKGEQKFIHEYTRTLLIHWAECEVLFGQMPQCDGSAKSKAVNEVFVTYAQSKGWVSKDGLHVTSKGFLSAAGRVKNG